MLEIHRDQIVRYGGTAGIRNLELLKSALGLPAATYDGDFLHTDIYEMAAAYLFHIVKNHPFIDGNKRTASMIAMVFFASNFHGAFTICGHEYQDLILGVAEGRISKKEIAQFFRKNCRLKS